MVDPAALLNGILPPGRCSLVGLPFAAFDRGAADDSPARVPPGVNLAAVAGQAALARRLQLDVVLVGGTTDEWPSQTLSERLAIARAWREALPAGQGPKLMLHTGANALGDAQALAALALELKVDGVLISAPTVFCAPDLATHCETVAAAIAPCHGALPVFYYHFPRLYNDNFPAPELLATLRTRCPEVVGAKLAGLAESDVLAVLRDPRLTGFGVVGTGLSVLGAGLGDEGLRGWICYPWETVAARRFIRARGVENADSGPAGLVCEETRQPQLTATMSEAGLSAVRNEVVGARAEVCRAGAYSLSADKAFMSAWSGVDVGPCRLPLASMEPQAVAGLLDSLLARKLLPLP